MTQVAFQSWSPKRAAVNVAPNDTAYRTFGLLDETPSIPEDVEPGTRFFEVELVRDGASTAWFSRNGYRIPTGSEPTLPEALLTPEVRMLETAVYKRRWSARDWDAEMRDAARDVLAERLEDHLHASETALTARVLLDGAERDARIASLHEFLGAGPDGLAPIAREVIAASAVPFLAAYRYTDAGLDKRTAWESTWALQRREDAGETVTIPVPPKYDAKDFRDGATWRLRGKLDVPKERFISYPGAEKDDDPSPVYGWAGWVHLQQARALTALYLDRKNEAGWGATDAGRARLVPLLAGLLELVPWLLQWHDAPHPDFGGEGPGTWYARYVEAEARALRTTLDALRAWRPPARGRARKAAVERPDRP